MSEKEDVLKKIATLLVYSVAPQKQKPGDPPLPSLQERRVELKEETRRVVEEGIVSVGEVATEAFRSGFEYLGKLFEKNMIRFPQLAKSGALMKEIKDEIFTPYLKKTGGAKIQKATVILGTILEDVHDIGKDLVGLMLEASNFEVIDIDVDQEPTNFIETAKQHNATIIGASALLTTTMGNLRVLVEERDKHFPNKEVKVIIGGAPTSQEFAASIGADGWAKDCIQAVKVVEGLI